MLLMVIRNPFVGGVDDQTQGTLAVSHSPQPQ